jgi:ketosteroid isomerase-like protein
MATQQELQQAASVFFDAYRNLLLDQDDISDTRDILLGLLTDDVEWTYTGKPGAIPFSGLFIGATGVSNALGKLTDSTNTQDFLTEEFLTESYAVDFTQQEFLTPQANRVAVIAEENQTVVETGLGYRLDLVTLLTIEDSGLVSDVHFYYDAYVPSQVFADETDLIVNPDIDPVLDPLRDANITSEESLNAALGFFGTFAQIQGDDFSPLLNVISPDTVISFAGDPAILPFADDVIRQGSDQVLRTFEQQLADSLPRNFDIDEFFVGGDRIIANTFEERTAVQTSIGYDVQVQILLTAEDLGEGDLRINSIQGNFDSSITTTAFTGNDLFPISSEPKPPVRMQGDNEFINLTGFDTQVTVGLEVFSESAYDNSIGIFKVDDITGRIGGLNPGDAGYLQQAVGNTVLNFDRGTITNNLPRISQSTLSTTLEGGGILAAYIITNGTAQDLLTNNPSNAQVPGTSNIFYTFMAANPDDFDHFRLLGSTFFAEDLWGGGDQDFNDMQFAVTVNPLSSAV